MPSDDPSVLSTEIQSPVPERGRYGPVVLLAAGAIVCLVIAAAAGAAAGRDLTRKPNAAERAAAAALAVADRWREWPAGRIFPATLSYSTSLLSTETAHRVSVARHASCSDAVVPPMARLARQDHCRAGLRATYLDQPEGVLYTIGVLAFPNRRDAEAFAARLPTSQAAPIALRPLALPGTASSQFSPAAGQAATASHEGPFVILTVAGYADGEPAGAGQQPRSPIFAPAAQLAGEVIGPLARPVTVNCASRDWKC